MKHISFRIVLEVLMIIMFFGALGLKFLDMTSPVVQPLTANPLSLNQTELANVPYETTLVGEYNCLPRKDVSASQLRECTLGLKLDNGKHVAVDLTQENNLTKGDRLELHGTFVPIEQLNSDHWQKYEMIGILSVTELKKLQ